MRPVPKPNGGWRVGASVFPLPFVFNPLQTSRTPVTLSVVAACVVVFLLQLLTQSTTPALVELGALSTPLSNPYFRPWQLVTYGFLHGGFGHLFFNMLGLFFFGPVVERAFGTQRYTAYYLVCLVGAGVAQLLVAGLMGTGGPVIGASGAVLGVLLAFAVLYPDEKIYLNFLFPIKAKYFVPGYALIDLFAGLSGAQSGVAHFAHLGGMLAGLPLALAWKRSLRLR